MHVFKNAQVTLPNNGRCLLVGLAVVTVVVMLARGSAGVVDSTPRRDAGSSSGPEPEPEERMSLLETLLGDEDDRAQLHYKIKHMLRLDGDIKEKHAKQTMQRYRPPTTKDGKRIKMSVLGHLNNYGVSAIKSGVDEDLIPAVVSQILTQFLEINEDDLGAIPTPYHRYDVPQHFAGPVRKAMCQVVQKLKPLLIKTLGESPRLAELSTLITFPGAGPQKPHRDSLEFGDDVAKLYSFFVPMIDIVDGVGGTEVWAGTHTDPVLDNSDMVRYPVGDERAPGRKCPVEREVFGTSTSDKCVEGTLMQVKAGGCVIMDSLAYHRSSYFLDDEKSDQRPELRPLFMFSLLSSEGRRPVGPTYTLLQPEYDDKDIFGLCEHGLGFDDSNSGDREEAARIEDEAEQEADHHYHVTDARLDRLTKRAVALDKKRVKEIDQSWNIQLTITGVLILIPTLFVLRKIILRIRHSSATAKAA